jgi:hypothetical protein
MRTVNECTKALTTFLMADDCAGDDLSPEDVRSSLGILRAAREACYRAENRLDLLLPMARTAPTPP